MTATDRAPGAAASVVPPDPALPGLAELAGHLQVLAREAQYAALEGDTGGLADTAERMLTEHVEWARRYRAWLAGSRAHLIDGSWQAGRSTT